MNKEQDLINKQEILLQWEFYSNEYKRKPTKCGLKKIQSLEKEYELLKKDEDGLSLDTNNTSNKEK